MTSVFYPQVTWWVVPLRQELLTLLELQRSSRFCVGFALLFSFLCSIIIGCQFVLFLLNIVMSVLRSMASGYPFGVFKVYFLSNSTRIKFRFIIDIFDNRSSWECKSCTVWYNLRFAYFRRDNPFLFPQSVLFSYFSFNIN
jgi:hypothetical protein